MTDYNFLMEIRLSPAQLQALNYISRLAAMSGVSLYLTGGAVRDLTIGRASVRNLDFAVEGSVQKILREMEAEKSGRAQRGALRPEPAVRAEEVRFDAKRNTASLTLSGGVRVEITGARRRVTARPGRAPEFVSSSIFEDLRNRDFSANAMAISLHPNSRGLLLDPTNGAADIENKEFRALHSHSFLDDPARIYRLLRLELRLGFQAEQRTQIWLDRAIEARAWESMSEEQQGDELRAALQEENPARVLRLFSERGLAAGLDRIFAGGRIPYDRLEKVRTAVRALPGADAFLLYFHALAEKATPDRRKQLAAKVLSSPTAVKAALALESDARKLAKTLSSAGAATPSFVYTLLKDKPQPLILFLLAYFPQAKVQTRVKNFLFKYPQVRARLPQAELHALGVEPGPRSDKILDTVFLAMLNGKVKKPTQVTKMLHDLSGVAAPGPQKSAPETKKQPAGGSSKKAIAARTSRKR